MNQRGELCQVTDNIHRANHTYLCHVQSVLELLSAGQSVVNLQCWALFYSLVGTASTLSCWHCDMLHVTILHGLVDHSKPAECVNIHNAWTPVQTFRNDGIHSHEFIVVQTILRVPNVLFENKVSLV